jgi:hypothetical protein
MTNKEDNVTHNQFLKQFELVKSEYDEFWDSYEKDDIWLGEDVRISIAVRSMSDYIPILFQKLMENQSVYDMAWKEFAARDLLTMLRVEWDMEEIEEEYVIDALTVSEITFGYDRDDAYCVWFSSTADCEHGVQVYGNMQGEINRAAIE